jgi:hypothetical protein
MTMRKITTLAAAAALSLGLAGRAGAVDPATFFDDCLPFGGTVDVFADTVVSGTPPVVILGDCTVNLFYGADLTIQNAMVTATGDLRVLPDTLFNKVTVQTSTLFAGAELEIDLADNSTITVNDSLLVAIAPVAAEEVELNAGTTVLGRTLTRRNILMSPQAAADAGPEIDLDSFGSSLSVRTLSEDNVFVSGDDVRIDSDGTTVVRRNDFTLAADPPAISGADGCTSTGNIPPYTC